MHTMSKTEGRDSHPAVPYAARFVVLMVCLGWAVATAGAQQGNESTGDDLFSSRPNTPDRQIRGAILAEKLDRPELGQGYLQDFMATNPTTEQLLSLRKKFGIGTFLKLSATKELQPTSRELLQLINEASRKETPMASTVELLIAELGQSDQQTRDAALKILSAESAAVAPLLAADSATPQGVLAQQILRKHIRRFRKGLLTSLPDADESTQVRILDLLAECADPDIVTDVIAYRFSESPAVAKSADHALSRLSGDMILPTSRDEAVQGLLSEAIALITRAGKPFPSEDDRRNDRRLGDVAAEQSAIYGTATLARSIALVNSATKISPDDPDVMAVRMVADLTAQSWPAQWPDDVALPEVVAIIDEPADTELMALQLATETGNAAAILSLLRRTDSSVAVFRHDARTTRTCLMHSDPRVRLFAAGIAKSVGIENQYVDGVLAAAVSTSEKPPAVVIDSRDNDGRSVSQALREMNYAAEAAKTGQRGFDAVTDQLHCELVLVHSNCLRWSLSHTIANLRADYRTQFVPIIVYGPERDRSRTQGVRERHAGVWFESEPISDRTLPEAMRLNGVPRPMLSDDERRQMITFARSLL